MPAINEKDFIKEIIFCIRQSDVVKAKALVQFFAEVPAKTQNRVLYELSKSPDEIAFPVLDYLCGVKSDQNRINQKIYDLLLEISFGNPGLINEYIQRNHANEITYIRIAGDLKMRESIPVLASLLKTRTEPEILAHAMQSLGAIGSGDSIPSLVAFLHTKDMVLKEAAIRALSEIGTPSAVEQLARAITGEDQTDAVVVEGLANNQSRAAIEKLCELLESRFANVRSMAIENLTRIGPKAVPDLTENLASGNDDARIHTLTVLGNIGDPAAAPAIQKLLFQNPENSNVRFGAYEALGQIRSPKTAISLAGGLSDPDEQVRLAAAKAIDNNLTHVLTAGLKNLIKAGDDDSRKIVATFIDSEADAVFTELVDWDIFPELAADYLAAHASPDTFAHYRTLLAAKKKDRLVERISIARQAPDKTGRKQIVAVDDSIMMLKLYTKKLHAFGYTPRVFQHPAQALAAIDQHKPDLVLTDLNMPEIDGLQLTREIRKKYKAAELPIIMITTQSDFVGGTVKTTGKPIDAKMIKKMGVNRVLHKPFSDNDLNAAIQQTLG